MFLKGGVSFNQASMAIWRDYQRLHGTGYSWDRDESIYSEANTVFNTDNMPMPVVTPVVIPEPAQAIPRPTVHTIPPIAPYVDPIATWVVRANEMPATRPEDVIGGVYAEIDRIVRAADDARPATRPEDIVEEP